MASSDRAYLFALGEAGPPRQLGLGAIWRRAQKSGNILVELSEEEVRQHSTTGHLEIRADANRHWPRRGDDIDDVEMPLLKEVEPTPGEKAGLKHDLTARAAASEAAAASLLAELETQEQEKKKKKKKKKTAKPKTELLAEEPPQGTPGEALRAVLEAEVQSAIVPRTEGWTPTSGGYAETPTRSAPVESEFSLPSAAASQAQEVAETHWQEVGSHGKVFTLHDVMRSMQYLEERLTERIDRLTERLTERIDRLTERIDRLDDKIDRLDDTIGKHMGTSYEYNIRSYIPSMLELRSNEHILHPISGRRSRPVPVPPPTFRDHFTALLQLVRKDEVAFPSTIEVDLSEDCQHLGWGQRFQFPTFLNGSLFGPRPTGTGTRTQSEEAIRQAGCD